MTRLWYSLKSAGSLEPYTALEAKRCGASVIDWIIKHRAESEPIPVATQKPRSSLGEAILQTLSARTLEQSDAARAAWKAAGVPKRAPLAFARPVIWDGDQDPGDADPDEDIAF